MCMCVISFINWTNKEKNKNNKKHCDETMNVEQ